MRTVSLLKEGIGKTFFDSMGEKVKFCPVLGLPLWTFSRISEILLIWAYRKPMMQAGCPGKAHTVCLAFGEVSRGGDL